MFAHIFTTRIKYLLRSKTLVFWTFLFPIVLAIFFNGAFSNLNNQEKFQPINVAVIDSTQYQQNKDFKSVMEDMSKGSDRTFNLTVTSKDNADKLLNDSKIDGYITVDNGYKVTVKNTGLNQTIIKSFLDNYSQTYSAVASMIKADPTVIKKGLVNDIGKDVEYTKEVSGTSAKPDNVMNYFYTLIAMTCMYAAFWGVMEVNDIQADISAKAARINVAPVHKLKTFLYSMSASLVLSFAEILLFLVFLRYALNINFGPKTGYVVLTAFVGCLVGLSMGALISAIIKKNLGMKIAVLLAVTMTGSFLAGMMYQDMKYIISQNAPIIGYLNPVNLLTDAFYALYYYDTYTRYALNMGILGAFTVVFCAATYFIIRRQKYASL